MTQEIKEKIKERYGKIAVNGNSECYCMPEECCGSDATPKEALLTIGYDKKELDSMSRNIIYPNLSTSLTIWNTYIYC